MGLNSDKSKPTWVIGFGVTTSKKKSSEKTAYLDDFAFVLDKDGQSAFVPWEELDHDATQIISDAYLLEALSDVHDSATTSFGLYHLQPASSPEIADFLVQAHITPLLRDLEIIEHGVNLAMERHTTDDTHQAIHLFFKKKFDAIHKIEKRIRHEHTQTQPKKSRGGRVQQGLVLTPG